MTPIQDSSWHTIDLQKLNGIGIYPSISSDVPEAIELFTMAEANRIDDIVYFNHYFCCLALRQLATSFGDRCASGSQESR